MRDRKAAGKSPYAIDSKNTMVYHRNIGIRGKEIGMKYYRTLDGKNRGRVLRRGGDGDRIFIFGADKWEPLPPDGGRYAEITEAEASELLEKQGEELKRLAELALEVAEKAHRDQKDKGGNPYINHPIAVAEQLENTEHRIVAYLHDVCEDSDFTFDDLLKMGFTERIVNSVRAITKTEGVSYEEYLRRVKEDETARCVKIADITHNMDLSRIPEPTDADRARAEKYRKALAFLKS